MSTAVLSLLPCASRAAAAVDATWIDGNSSWHNPAGWNIGAVPNNGADSYRVVIPGGTVEYDAPAVTVDSLEVRASAAFDAHTRFTTTIGLRIDGVASANGTLTVGSSGLLAGSGSLTLGPGPGFGTLLTSASSLTIDDGMHIRVLLGGVGTTSKPLINRGFITGGGGSTSAFVGGASSRLSFSSIQNLGTLEARDGGFYLDGNFTRADLGNLQWGSNGSFHIGVNATLDNVAQTFTIGAGERWKLSGTIHGGTMNIDPAASVIVPYWGGAVLDGVTVNGKIYHGGGMPLMASNLSGNAEFQLENRFLEGPSNIASNSTMTIGPNVLVHGAGGEFNPNFGNGSGLVAPTSITNHGTIRSDGEWGLGGITGELGIYTPTLVNDGKLATLSNSWLYASGNITFAPGGVLDVQVSPTTNLGLLRVVGSLDLTTANDSLVLSLGAGAQANEFYRIVTTAGGIAGEFDSISPNFELEFRSNHTELWARYVPEPSALALVVGGFLTLRRRRAAVV